MKRTLTVPALALACLSLFALFPCSLSAQERPPGQGGQPPQVGPPSFFSLGLSAGVGTVDNNRLTDGWDWGPVFGGRFAWSRGLSAAMLTVDVQPFRAGRTDRPGDFRTIYILPAYGIGSERQRLILALGMGVFDLTSETGDEGWKVGFVGGISGSFAVYRSLAIELGWKRIREVEGIRANLFSLQLANYWRL